MLRFIFVKSSLIISFALLLVNTTYGQIESNDWGKKSSLKVFDPLSSNVTLPSKFISYELDFPSFKQKIKSLQQEIAIPNPKGEMETYIISPTNIISADVAHQYSIKTFKGYKKSDHSVLLACDISDNGFHAAVYQNEHTFYVAPQSIGNPKKVMVHYKKDNQYAGRICRVLDSQPRRKSKSLKRAPNQKSVFRLAIAAAGEYAQQFGGSPYSATNVLNAIASGVNLINPLFNRDLGLEFTIVSGANLVFRNPNNDPFDGLDIEENQVQINSILGAANYDLGHLVMWANTGGVAGLDVTCLDSDKARGGSGENTSVTTLWIDYVAHEIGHQLGSEHNFAATSCGESVATHRFEPGEGSSMMSYASLCDESDSYETSSDPFFHYNSIRQMQDALSYTSCAMTSGGNPSNPVADGKNDITIPKETPFVLVGSATDGNDPINQLSYGWQQNDGSGPETQGAPNCNASNHPLFRYRPPTSNNFRNFPPYIDILNGNNNSVEWEKLSCVARDINFTLLVRDNNTSFGRTDVDSVKVIVANTGPFQITSPNGGEMVTGGQSTPITWTVNGTNAHCANVDILYSSDGGTTYTVIADATPNDGTQMVVMPNSASTSGRILVRCNVTGGFRSASTFFDVSNANFTITETLANEEDLIADDNCIQLYPKPTPGHFKIEGTLDNFTIQVLDINETLLQDFTGQGNSIDIDYDSLPSNYYFLRLENTVNSDLSFQTKIKD